MSISVLGWILLGCAAWLALAGVTAVLIARMIRLRDAQRPPESPVLASGHGHRHGRGGEPQAGDDPRHHGS
jgi:hypothetical protein